MWSIKSLIAENFILCLIFNFENVRSSQNVTKYLLNVGRKFLKISEFYFTLLPTSEFLLLRKKSSRVHLSGFIMILTTYLVSSLPEGQKLTVFLGITVPSHNKHTYNKHVFHNKRTLFVLTKMCSFGDEEDFGKINSMSFLTFSGVA